MPGLKLHLTLYVKDVQRTEWRAGTIFYIESGHKPSRNGRYLCERAPSPHNFDKNELFQRSNPLFKLNTVSYNNISSIIFVDPCKHHVRVAHLWHAERGGGT
jgi:hypothetical protein